MNRTSSRKIHPLNAAPTLAVALSQGLVVASHGRHCVVQESTGLERICHPRGKKSQAVVGDRVQWSMPASGQGEEGCIEKILPRRNLFYRQDEIRTKSFAANLDQVLILIAAEPVFSESQLARALIAAHAQGITPLIALNKSDLTQPFAQAWERLAPYRAMLAPHAQGAAHDLVLGLSLNHPASSLAASQGLAALRQRLHGKATLVLGPSGSGKSTLINQLVPDARAATGEISQALNSGKHTTTSTRWYWVDKGEDEAHHTALIDSPGFQEFGLHHIAPTDLARCMPDIGAFASHCRFYNCSHLHEPGCAVREQVDRAISARRYKIYSDLFAELSAAPRY